MSLTSLFERIIQKQKVLVEDRYTDHRSLVLSIADGQEPPADRLSRILAESGQTIDQLRSDVELILRRRQMRVQLDAIDTLQHDRAAVEREIATANGILSAAEDTHEQTTIPLFARLDEINAALRSGQEARRQLQETCNHSGLLHELDQLRADLAPLDARRAELQLRIKDHRDRATADLAEIKYAHKDSRAQELNDRADQLTQLADQMATELAEILSRLDDLGQQERRLMERMLVP